LVVAVHQIQTATIQYLALLLVPAAERAAQIAEPLLLVVLAVAVVAALRLERAVLVTPRQFPRHKETMVEMVHQAMQLAAAVAAHRKQEIRTGLVVAATARHHQFLVVA
jgi:hypothetical protein